MTQVLHHVVHIQLQIRQLRTELLASVVSCRPTPPADLQEVAAGHGTPKRARQNSGRNSQQSAQLFARREAPALGCEILSDITRAHSCRYHPTSISDYVNWCATAWVISRWTPGE